MKTIEYTITDALGIHARPAGLLVKEAGKFASKIMIASPKKEVDAKRIMGVMGLGVKGGDTVKLTIEGEDEETAAADTTPADEQDAAAQAGVTEEAQDTEAGAQGETQKKTVTRRLPLDMSKVELDLFAIDGIYINQLDGEF